MYKDFIWSDTDNSDDDIINKIEYKGAPTSANATNGGAESMQATENELFDELDRIQGKTCSVTELDNSDDENTAIQRAIVASLEK
jgi:hypothetical protein